MPAHAVERCQIEANEAVIRPYIRRTPVIEVCSADFGFGVFPITLKLESLQHTGSFKPRGAFTNLLARHVPESGVVAASGGNHGAAVAYAATKLGIKAKIFVPTVASEAKIARIRSYGAELVVGGERYADALEASVEWTAKSGAMPVHAYDQRETLLGQGSVGLEFQQQASELDTVLVSVGGGGLIGGIAAWYRGGIQVIGVEPEAAPTLHLALRAGKPVEAPAGGIAADSLAPRQVGDLMFPIARDYVSQVVLVSDDDIRSAQALLWERTRVVVEPGGAAAFAAVAATKYRPENGERIGVVLCGGNTGAVDFSR